MGRSIGVLHLPPARSYRPAMGRLGEVAAPRAQLAAAGGFQCANTLA